MQVYSRTFEFWWDEWVHMYIELRKPFHTEGPWNPACLRLEGVLSALPDPDQRQKEVFVYQYRELRALLGLALDESLFYHPYNNSTAANTLLWSGRYESEL